MCKEETGMTDQIVQRLLRRDLRPDLGNLEADIWRREAWFAARARASRLLTAWQSALIACAVIASGTVGFALTARALHDQLPHIAIPGEQFAPSALLFGAHR
jgi:hypothetical protein